ncbi:hypothetical protein IX321_000312 [Bacteroides pyogenes]|nr:hypothetical protein [Bacteroides pyogenes]MBR8716350.1 hypothetical protein [Bacteroides pyogenes]MBR8745714.1 hypothetical protein [Bacteroides pyogenes]MBR8756186.1 hypothetical protein [Bacteroides pyogenes]MBR8779324.1 hypothetical protein [Bacteroides pyogenes]
MHLENKISVLLSNLIKKGKSMFKSSIFLFFI